MDQCKSYQQISSDREMAQAKNGTLELVKDYSNDFIEFFITNQKKE